MHWKASSEIINFEKVRHQSASITDAFVETARMKWYERCKRVNYENLYFILIQRDGCSEEDLKAFDQFPSDHKVVFYHRKKIGFEEFLFYSLLGARSSGY